MVKATERRVLNTLNAGGALGNEDRAALVAKIAKGQSKSRARTIAGRIEAEYAAQFGALTQAEQAAVGPAMRNYVASSTEINTSCRANHPNDAARALDAAFAIYQQHGFTNVQRVVYRLMSYPPGAVIPYAAPAPGPRIVAGDWIQDSAFLSTSEHRQFLVNGINNPVAGTRYVKFVIIGQGGMNVSGGGGYALAYTNANQEALLRLEHPHTHALRTADAGQAEILYPRNLILRVESVSMVDQDIHVAATIPMPQPNGVTKNAYSGV